MRYKNQVLDKLTNLETTANRIDIQVNRGMSVDEVSASIQSLKQQIESIRESISIEPDDFEIQFSPQ